MRADSSTPASVRALKGGALAGVGVADEGDHGDRDCLAALPLLMADPADGVELGLDMVDAKVNLAAIGLELGFARAAGSDAAAKLRHGASASCKAGQLVFELCEFYLELAARASSREISGRLKRRSNVMPTRRRTKPL
jgi:hypothetical protein